MDFRHHSWDKTFRTPFGALPIGSAVTLKVFAPNASNIELHTYYWDQECRAPMLASKDTNFWEITLPLPESPGILWYDFSFEVNGVSYTYGTQCDHLGGEGAIYETSPSSYQITLYDPKRKSPEWYTQGIMYQIFPDRFNRGSDFNLDNFPENAILHANWGDYPHYFRGKKGSIDYWDFFGGTLTGITEKLDYLKSLHVSILYLNPIFKSRSNHRYDTGDYMTIDPILGTQASFENLASECKKRGISIILDGVFNHTGDDSLYFNRYGTYPTTGAFQSKSSPYYLWYNFIQYPSNYSSWWGIDAMPNVNEMYPDFQNFIFNHPNSVIRHWMNAGASGWRLDVADELPDEFITGLKDAMIKENPDSILIGEVWEDASRKIAYDKLRTYFSGHELDAVMNYPFRETFISFILGEKSAPQVQRIMMSLYEHYPKDQFMGNMNLIGSHDRRRILTVLGESYDYLGDIEPNPSHLSENQYDLAKKRLKFLSLIQMTFPGVPCIYYGDEVGVEGFEDPDNRRTFPWGKEDTDLLDWYRTITTLRAENKVLQKGTWEPHDAGDDLLVFDRIDGDDICICLFNRNSKAIHLYNDPDHIGYIGIDLLTKTTISLNPIIVEPLSFAVIAIKQKKELLVI